MNTSIASQIVLLEELPTAYCNPSILAGCKLEPRSVVEEYTHQNVRYRWKNSCFSTVH
jgi:hypothetical protein